MIDDFRKPVFKADSKPTSKPSSDKPEAAILPRVDMIIDEDAIQDDQTEPPKKQRRSPIKWFKDLPKKQKLIALAICFLLIFVLGGSAFAFYRTTQTPDATPAPVVQAEQKKEEEPPKPTTVPSPLTGVTVPPEFAKRPVTAIMIENSPDARPQSGIKQAGMVFEAVAEGGITRFLTLFQEDQPDYIGPIRSARPYYVEWAYTFDAAYAHVGGSGDGLAAIRNYGVKDMDQGANAAYFQRITQRYAPHNVYTSMAKLDELKNKKGFTSSTFTSFPRKADSPSAQPTAKSIDVSISSFLYNSHYDYDAASNSYLRSQAGKPHTDERSKQQLAPKTLVVVVAKQGLAANRIHTTYQVDGTGTVFVFQDGTVTKGTWKKDSPKSQYTFTDGAGKPIAFNAGQTWFALIGSEASVSSQP